MLIAATIPNFSIRRVKPRPCLSSDLRWLGWCGRRDLNPHAFRRHPLKMVCLPIPPLPQMTTHENHTLSAEEQSDYIRTHARHDFVHGDRIEVMTETMAELNSASNLTAAIGLRSRRRSGKPLSFGNRNKARGILRDEDTIAKAAKYSASASEKTQRAGLYGRVPTLLTSPVSLRDLPKLPESCPSAGRCALPSQAGVLEGADLRSELVPST